MKYFISIFATLLIKYGIRGTFYYLGLFMAPKCVKSQNQLPFYTMKLGLAAGLLDKINGAIFLPFCSVYSQLYLHSQLNLDIYICKTLNGFTEMRTGPM